MRDENARLRGLDAGELADLLALRDVFAHEPFDPRAVVSAPCREARIVRW